ncbi:hypothetical protein ACQP3J_31510, partial [Escherichia coli]
CTILANGFDIVLSSLYSKADFLGGISQLSGFTTIQVDLSLQGLIIFLESSNVTVENGHCSLQKT